MIPLFAKVNGRYITCMCYVLMKGISTVFPKLPKPFQAVIDVGSKWAMWMSKTFR